MKPMTFKVSKVEANLNMFKDRGHQPRVSGTGTHKSVHQYDRKKFNDPLTWEDEDGPERLAQDPATVPD